MDQLSFASLDFAAKKKRTKRDVFLAEMGAVVPWVALEGVIEPQYPKTGPQGGRRLLRRPARVARPPAQLGPAGRQARLTRPAGRGRPLTRGRTLTSGRRVALSAVGGVELGYVAHVIAAAAGISAILAASAAAFTAVKVAGACYLVWLGITA